MAGDWTVALRKRLKDALAVAPPDPPVPGLAFHWGRRPDGRTPPDVIMLALPSTPGATFEGDQELAETRVQFDCWAADRGTARRIANWCRSAISPPAMVQVVEPAAEAGTTRFDRAFCDEPDDGGEQTETGYVHRARFDAMVWHAPA